MIFEIYRDGKRLMWTEHKECMPSDEQITSMKKAGCKVILDGKTYKVEKKKR